MIICIPWPTPSTGSLHSWSLALLYHTTMTIPARSSLLHTTCGTFYAHLFSQDACHAFIAYPHTHIDVLFHLIFFMAIFLDIYLYLSVVCLNLYLCLPSSLPPSLSLFHYSLHHYYEILTCVHSPIDCT